MRRGQKLSWRQNDETPSFNKIQPSQVHFPEEPCFCDACRQGFSDKQINMDLEDGTLSCSSCEDSFPRKNLLIDHILQNHRVVRIRPTTKPYHCSICSKSFSRKDHASAHANLHLSKRKNISCDKCPLQFNWKSNLNAHKKRIHSTHRPFKCDLCKKRLLSRYELMNHINLHHSRKIFKFKCQFCSKGVRRSDHLEVHVRSHLQEKPYVCDRCKREFAHLKSLKHHCRTSH